MVNIEQCRPKKERHMNQYRYLLYFMMFIFTLNPLCFRADQNFLQMNSVILDQADALYDRGVYLHTQGKDKKAISYFTQAISLDPQHAYAYAARGFCYGEINKWKNGLKDINMAIKLDPLNGRFYQIRACTLERLDDKNSAKNDYITAARLGDELAIAVLHKRSISW
jgi:tetratricopeptide (TPR) repeat protein